MMVRVGIGMALVLSCLAGAAGPALAQPAQREWVRVNGDERVTAYVDRRSIRRNGDLVRFDGLIEYFEPDEDGVKQLVHSGELSCARRDYRIIGFEVLDSAGTVIASHSSEDPPTPINEDSPNAALHAEFCG